MNSPVTIAILADFNNEHLKPLGKQTGLIQQFFQFAETRGIDMGVFHPMTLIKTKTPKGYYWGTDIWKLRQFNYPCVVYDRFYSSMGGINRKIQNHKMQIERMGIPFLNPLLLSDTLTDKKRFAVVMKEMNIQSPEVIPVSYGNPQILWNHLSTYHNLVLKPRFGRMGKCIFRLEKQGTSILVSFHNRIIKAENKWNLSGIIRYFCRINGILPTQLILQKTVDIPLINQRFFDIRILVQRVNGTAKPSITGEVARLGRADRTVPNIDQGGIVIPVEHCLSLIQKTADTTQNLLEDLRNSALQAYQKLESLYGMIGEAGIDLLIDKNRNIWIIEMNSKPGRIAFERLASGFGLSLRQKQYFAQLRKISILNPVTYCQWLAIHSR